MTFLELQNQLNRFKPVFYLENSISHKVRLLVKKIIFVFLIISGILSSGYFKAYTDRASGLFFLFLFFFLLFFVLDSFYYSHYFPEKDGDVSYELAQILYNTPAGDVTKGFIKSEIGQIVLSRSGLSQSVLQDFLNSRKLLVSTSDLKIEVGSSPVSNYVLAVLNADREFRNLILAHGLTDSILEQATTWVLQMISLTKRHEHWWSESSLQNVKPIGRDWSYGVAYDLLRWSSPIHFFMDQEDELHTEEEATLETLLSRSRDANVLIVGEEGSGKMEILEGVARKMFHKKVSASLVDKKILIIDTALFVAQSPEKSVFEQNLISIFNGAVSAGNIILVFPDFPSFVSSAEALQSDIVGILNPYLTSPSLHVVGVCDLPGFHQFIETNDSLKTRFETIMVKEGDEAQVLKILEEEILLIESHEGVFFTYPAIVEAVRATKQYIVEQSLFEGATDVLYNTVAYVKSNNKAVVFVEDVLTVIKNKTGIPTGAIDDAEKTKLQNLEQMLHERVVGQDEAIAAISDALRRARSGIGNPSRPIGSFLFLGPTGVGKTETTKALAEIFFGEKAKILRIDMSEYNTPDALNRLIGAYDGETPGTLSSMVRESPYGVLLLDEFEKTDKKVLDLFLQILDEGFFTDVLGRKVNARNLIIVATSNAGSQNIFDAVEKKQLLSEKKESIVDSIVQNGIFKPELLNRFDGIILFHPLSDAQLKDVAKIMLQKLSWRLKEKGMQLVVNEPLLEYLVKVGSDPKFGARPLNRAIQDTLEKKIADKIIAGELRPGSSVEFGPNDFI